MGKMKIYELAKELNVESKRVVEYLQQQGFVVKNHMSVMDDAIETAARHQFGAPAPAKPTVKRIKKEDVAADPSFRPVVKRIKKEDVAAERAEAAVVEAKEAAPVEAATAKQPEQEAAQPQPQEAARPAEKPEEKAAPQPQEVKVEPAPARTQSEQTVVAQPELVPAKAEKPEEAEKPEKPEKTEKPEKPMKTEPKAADGAPARNNRDGKDGRDNRNQNRDGKDGRDNRGGRDNRESRGQNRDNCDNRGGQNRDNRDNRGQNRDNRDNRDNRGQNRDNQYRDNRDNRGQNRDNRDNRGNQNRDNRDNRGQNRDNRDSRDNRGGYQSRPAAAPEVVYTPAAALSKPDSRRPDKKKKDNRDQKYNDNFGGKMDKGSKNNRPRNKYKEQKRPKVEIAPATPKKVVIGETIILSELAKSMHKTASELIKKLFEMGIMATINQSLDSDTAILLADEFGVEIEVRQEKIVEILEDDIDNPRDLKERPAVVTVMGHVDHGKTSLLDAIRNTRVTTTEAGGITQHIGAYQVEISGKKITFLDTPGHEAFTSMRARGAQVTDIVILVVAADDGIMPQTVEAINHAKAANVPIIVAINKIDKPGANVDKVKQQLMEYELVGEEYGGDTIMVPVSAKQNMGIENLLEMVLLVAEVAELKANPKRQARGTIIEAKLDKNRGPVATLLVQKGTLKIGETIVAGSVFGKVRAMNDDVGKTIHAAGPSQPVEILGFAEVPEAGETFIAIKDERDARYAAQIQAIKKREEEMRKSAKVSLDDLFAKISEGDIKELNIIIKADVRGSVEAISQSLEKLSTDEVKVRIIHVGVGAINESDVTLADASNAIIIGFNVRPNAQTRKAAELALVDMRLYSVIYDAIEDVKKAMLGLLEPEFKETWQGQVEVRSTFRVPKVGLVAGGYVLEGKITRNSEVRIVRDGIIIFQGKLASLKRFKDDVKEVMQGFECGIGIENYNDLKEGDIIEAFIMEETVREEL